VEGGAKKSGHSDLKKVSKKYHPKAQEVIMPENFMGFVMAP
jgi:hypothetical protein